MTDLYDLTRALVARGCPEHPRLWYDARVGMEGWLIAGSDDLHPNDARAIWTMWALEWWFTTKQRRGYSTAKQDDLFLYVQHDSAQAIFDCGGRPMEPESLCDQVPTILEAIEAATRHLDTKLDADWKELYERTKGKRPL